MSSVRWLVRWLVVGVVLGSMPGATGCRRDSTTGTKAQPQKKPIAQLTGEDLRKPIESLGYEIVTATSSESGGHKNTTVIGFREHPDGEEGADGKKRLRVLVSLNEDPEDGASRAAGLAKMGAAYKRDGRHTLSVELSNKDREEAKKILDMLTE